MHISIQIMKHELTLTLTIGCFYPFKFFKICKHFLFVDNTYLARIRLVFMILHINKHWMFSNKICNFWFGNFDNKIESRKKIWFTLRAYLSYFITCGCCNLFCIFYYPTFIFMFLIVNRRKQITLFWALFG